MNICNNNNNLGIGNIVWQSEKEDMNKKKVINVNNVVEIFKFLNLKIWKIKYLKFISNNNNLGIISVQKKSEKEDTNKNVINDLGIVKFENMKN